MVGAWGFRLHFLKCQLGVLYTLELEAFRLGVMSNKERTRSPGVWVPSSETKVTLQNDLNTKDRRPHLPRDRSCFGDTGHFSASGRVV